MATSSSFVTASNNTVIKFGDAAAIVDAVGDIWTITAGGQVAVNGAADDTTANVIELAYVNDKVWQENSSNLWWGKTSAAGAWEPPAGTSTSPVSAASTTSADDTVVVVAGSTAAITDAAGDNWTISGGDSVFENGTAAAFTANVAEIAYVNDTVWHENTAQQWYSWTGSGWAAGNDPLPAQSVTPTPPATPAPTASASDTAVLAGSTSAITDAAGNRWKISAADTVLEDGTAAGFTANVAEIAYVNGTVWHENTAQEWYSWTGSSWDVGNDPLPVPTATSAPTASANDTIVLAGAASAITDAAGNLWTVSAADTVLEDGTAAGFTANVAEIAYVDGTVWHENTAQQWYSWSGSGWTVGNPGLTPITTPMPTPPPTATPSPTASASDTFVLAGSTDALIDAAGDRWTISSTDTVQENGQAAGFTANVAEIAYVDGTVWHENSANQWYSWGNSAWTSGTDPLPASGGTGSSTPGATGSNNGVGSSLSLAGYHLTFDWEANDFANNPTPSGDAFTTTLSAGLRYLSNGDQEYWSDSSTGQSPYSLSNGALNINATYVGAGNTPGGGNLSYDSGVFTTQGLFSQQYGYFEMRAELPAGAGMWPAFWMLNNNSDVPGNWPPELDALEAFGAANANGEGGPTQAHWDVHSQNTAQQAGAWATMPANTTTSFNTYGVLWTPTQISFVYDGTIVAQTPTPSDYTQAMYMIVNLAVGGTWPGDATGENGTMKVDYLRAFSSNSAIPAAALQTISSPDGGGYSMYGASTTTAASSLVASAPH